MTSNSLTDSPHCPHCNARLIPAPDRDALWCQFCGMTLDDVSARERAVVLRRDSAPLSGYDPPGADWVLDPDLLRALNTAWADIHAGKLADARYTLENARGRFAESADVHYLLALATHDPDEKRAHLAQALAIQPYHDYAWRDQGVLNGVIPPGDAPDAPGLTPDAPVEAISETQVCPRCGGHLTYSVAASALVCRHCGYTPGAVIPPRAAPSRRPTGYRNLEDALLQRRYGFSHQWDIGARLLTCRNCHAQLTLAQDLATLCPFCDSAHILIEDAAGSFEEPDAILPFSIDRARAAKAVHAHLSAELRPQIARGEMWGVYLPFWIFAGTVALALPPDGASEPVSLRPGMYAVSDALVAGVEHPSQAVLYALMPFDLDALVPYDRRYLGRWSAQVYRVDVIQASLTARAYLKHVARAIATGRLRGIPPADLARTDSDAYNPPNSPLWRAARVDVTEMYYRLVLLPVWMITLILRDGSRRPAIVNGQTGETVVSASFHRDSIISGPTRPPVTPLPPASIPRRASVIRPIDPPPGRRR